MELSITELANNESPLQKNNFQNGTNIKSILKTNAPNNKNTKRVSYDDILAKMGMYVENGKLHLENKNEKCNDNNKCSGISQCTKVKCNRIQEYLRQQTPPTYAPNIQNKQNIPNNQLNQNNQTIQNSYIYNKHFKNHILPEPVKIVPTNPQEYRQMMLTKILQNNLARIRVNKIKSTKLMMSTDNINISREQQQAKLNRLFHFSQR